MADKKITINLSDDTYSKIEKIITYSNLRHELKPKLNMPYDHSIEDFIMGCVNLYLNKIEHLSQITNLNHSSHGKLQNRIKEIIIKKGWNQKKLAELTNLDPGTISPILSNKTQPSMENFLRIWKVLGMPDLDKVFYRK